MLVRSSVSPIRHRRSSLLLLSVSCVLALSGCASTEQQYGLDGAKDLFKERLMKPPVDETLTGDAAARSKEPLGPRRRLLQVRYSEKSLQDPDFLQYLNRYQLLRDFSTATSSAPATRALSEAELETNKKTEQWFALRQSAQRQVTILQAMKAMQAGLEAFEMPSPLWEKDYPDVRVNFRNAPLNVVLRGLAERSGLRYQPSPQIQASRLKVNGSYTGTSLEVIAEIVSLHRLKVLTPSEGGSLWVYDASEKAQADDGKVQAFEVSRLTEAEKQTIESYKRIVELLRTGSEDAYTSALKELKPPRDGLKVAEAYALMLDSSVELTNALKALDKLTQNGPADTLTTDGKTNGSRNGQKTAGQDLGRAQEELGNYGILDNTVCQSEEIVTERIFIYSEVPKTVRDYLDSYFTGTPIIASASSAGQSVTDAGSSGGASSNTVSPGDPSSASTQKTPQPIQGGSASSCTSYTKTKPVMIDDPLGLVVTGTRSQIDIAVRLAEDRDIPSKQVLAEVFLVEVAKNWAQTLETSLRGREKAFAAGGLSELYAALQDSQPGRPGLTGRFVATPRGNNLDVFIRMLEENSVGRTISSPTLVARDGQTASIKKELTLRKEVIKSDTVISNGTTNTNSQPEIKTLPIPFEMTIKPTIKQHNNHVVFEFSYTETTVGADFDPSNPTAASTTVNTIKTFAETAPGDVIVLAGLFKESNTTKTDGLPGVARLGPISGLLGGSDIRSMQSTELLVFIRPSVIEPRAHAAQLNSVK